MKWIIPCLLVGIVLVIVAIVKLRKHEDSEADEKDVIRSITQGSPQMKKSFIERCIMT